VRVARAARLFVLIQPIRSIFFSRRRCRSRRACLSSLVAKGGEMRDTKTLNLSRNIVSLQILARCFAFFTLRDQPVAQQ